MNSLDQNLLESEKLARFELQKREFEVLISFLRSSVLSCCQALVSEELQNSQLEGKKEKVLECYRHQALLGPSVEVCVTCLQGV